MGFLRWIDRHKKIALVASVLPVILISVVIGVGRFKQAERNKATADLQNKNFELKNISDARYCIKHHIEDAKKEATLRCPRVDIELLPDGMKADYEIALKRNNKITVSEINEIDKRAKEIIKSNAALASKQQSEQLEPVEWIYEEYTDDATGKKSKRAYLISKNRMNFGFPYEGAQYGRFYIRNHPRYGVDAFLTVSSGQLLCNTFSNDTVLVRFDNREASSYRCSRPADYSSNSVFIRDVARLESGMKIAKRMFITVNVYGEGSRTWKFNVRGYDRSKV